MRVTLRLNAHLRHFAGLDDTDVELEVREGERLEEIFGRLGIPQNEVFAAVVDGRRVPFGHLPAAGEHIEVLPAISGG